MGWDKFLHCMVEGFLFTLCNKTDEVTIIPLENLGELTTFHIDVTIDRPELEDLIVQLHQDATLNHRYKVSYTAGDITLTPAQLYVIMFYVIDAFKTKGVLDDTYHIVVDYKANAVFKSKYADVPTQTPTPSPVVKQPVKTPTVNISGVLATVGKMGKKYAYRRHTYSTAAGMRKHGYGDCWAMAAFLCQELTKRGVKAKRQQGVTKYSNAHRWCMYYSGGKWHPFPYKTYGINSMFAYTTSVKGVHDLSGCGS